MEIEKHFFYIFPIVNIFQMNKKIWIYHLSVSIRHFSNYFIPRNKISYYPDSIEAFDFHSNEIRVNRFLHAIHMK